MATATFALSGVPADLVLLDFTQPQLRSTRHPIASVVSRVTPAEVLLTMRQGRMLYQSDGFASFGRATQNL